MALDADTRELIAELVKQLTAAQRPSAGASLAGSPQQNNVLMGRDPLTGQLVPLDVDSEGGGLRATMVGTIPSLTVGSVTLPTLNPRGQGSLVLDATTKKLQIILGGAISTNQLPVTVCYEDWTSSAVTPGEADTVTNGNTAVDIVAAPAASTYRTVKGLYVQNADTAAATVTIRYNNNGTTRVLFKAVLSVGDMLSWHDWAGWQVFDASGNLKFPNLNITAPVGLRGDGGIRKLAGVLLGAGDTLIFTADQAYTDVMVICANVDTVTRTFQLYHGTVSDANIISNKNQQIVLTDPPPFFMGIGMANGSVLHGLCDSANKVAVAVYGAPVTAGA
jgi:hypothetical protein